MTASARPGVLALLLASGICLLSGCSGGATHSTTTTTTAPATSGPTSTSTTTTAAASGAAGACTTTELVVTIGTGAATAGGTSTAPFVVKDTGGPCSLSGYFGLALLNANGRPLGTSPIREAAITEGTAPAATVVLGGTRTAVFGFQWPSDDPAGGSCPMATTVELTAPDQTDHVTIPATTAGGRPIVLCGDGQTYIGPVTASG